MITETSSAIDHWSVYNGRLDLASTGRVSLIKAFADVVRFRLEIEPYELSLIFAAPSDDAENDCLKDLVALQSRYFIDDFLLGVMKSFTRPFGGGEVVPMPARMWELDNCLPRFATGALNLEHWADSDAEPTHHIFVDKQHFERLLMSLPTDDTLSDYQLRCIFDPRYALMQREQHKQNEQFDGAPSPIENGSSVLPIRSNSQDRLIGLEKVKELSGFGRSKIYAMMSDGHFPKRVGDGGKALWSEREVDRWVEQRKDSRLKSFSSGVGYK